MQDMFFNNFQPKLDAHELRIKDSERRLHELERRFEIPPKIEINITGNNADFVLENAAKAYDKFGNRTNFALKVILNELANNSTFANVDDDI